MFRFKKIASVLTSAVMLSSTIGFAAAASYPQPFVTSGLADAAVVYGANAAISDVTSAIDVQQKLGALATSGTATVGGAVTGEAAQLFTGGTKIYINDSLNAVKSVLTKTDLPTVLKAESFSGNVDASITHTIDLGSNPRVTFKRQPTSSDDPNLALQTSTTQANYIYNATATFSKNINFTHPDSEGSSIRLFGMDFTIGSATDSDTLVLLKSATKLNLDSDNPAADVTVAGKTYTVELISASDTAATVKVTDSSGASDSKEINEAASKKIQGITVAVITADETNLKLSASIIAGSDKITLEDNVAVKIGEEDTSIDGTLVRFGNGTEAFPVGAMPKLTISVYASESDKDAIRAGEALTDPVYGSFKLNFAGLNIPTDSATAREMIELTPSSDDKMNIKFKDHRGHEKSFQWAKDIVGNVRPGVTGGAQLMSDDDNRNITVVELQNVTSQGLVVVGNEDEGHLLKLTGVKNSSNTGSSNTDGDKVEFTDVFSSDVYKTTWTSDGVGTMIVGGKTYNVYLTGNANNATENYQVHIDYPDSTAKGHIIVYPTIQTSKGAKVAFYKPVEIPLSHWGVRAGDATPINVTKIRFPDGDGYEDVDIVRRMGLESNATLEWNITADGTTNFLNLTIGSGTKEDQSTFVKIESLVFNFTMNNFTDNTGNQTVIYLQEPDGSGNINSSALIVWNEKDDNSNYEANIVVLELGRSSDDGLGVDSSLTGDTWSNASSTYRATRSSDSKITDVMDLWGTLTTIDAGDSDQAKATLSYPDEQVYAQLYFAAESAAITPGQVGGGAGGGGQVLIVKDSEVSSVASKNLFVVGGSCINTVAAKILGSDSPLCAADFTAKTNTGVGQYIIKSVKSPYNDQKIALLVAGYEAADTMNAVKKAMEGVTTDAGTEQVYPIASA
jgi:hypothetical protein